MVARREVSRGRRPDSNSRSGKSARRMGGCLSRWVSSVDGKSEAGVTRSQQLGGGGGGGGGGEVRHRAHGEAGRVAAGQTGAGRRHGHSMSRPISQQYKQYLTACAVLPLTARPVFLAYSIRNTIIIPTSQPRHKA